MSDLLEGPWAARGRFVPVRIGDGVNPPVVEEVSEAEERRLFGEPMAKRTDKKISAKPKRVLYRTWRNNE